MLVGYMRVGLVRNYLNISQFDSKAHRVLKRAVFLRRLNWFTDYGLGCG